MTYAEIASALPDHAVTQIEGLAFPRIASGKVREIFDLGDALLIVATDRLSAFDVILPDGIPGKGIVLQQISNHWFEQTRNIIPNHLLPDQLAEHCPPARPEFDRLVTISRPAMESATHRILYASDPSEVRWNTLRWNRDVATPAGRDLWRGRVNGHTNCTTVRPQTRYHPAQAKRAHAREVAHSANKRARAHTHT